jgi:CheY-like chemotaxis protein
MAPRSILVVDDDPSVRRVVSFWLQAEGVRVYQAESAEQALATLFNTEVDAMVTDVRLPGIDGPTLARIASHLDYRPSIYVMSAFPRPAETEPVRFFQKPEQLGDLVRQLLHDATGNK